MAKHGKAFTAGVKLQNGLCVRLDQWFRLGVILPSGNVWQCLETPPRTSTTDMQGVEPRAAVTPKAYRTQNRPLPQRMICLVQNVTGAVVETC